MLNRIEAPPERKAPPLAGGRAGNVSDHANTHDNIETPSKSQLNRVVGSVRSARTFLMRAQFDLDDAGFSCLALDDLNDDVATLLCEWAGRRRPADHSEVPAWIAAAATEWRSERARRVRR